MSKHFRRSLKNITNGYSSVEIQVRNATSNESWGPSSSELNEIALLTYHDRYVYDVINVLEKRLFDRGKKWRHVLKSLTVILYCLIQGSDVFASAMKRHLAIFLGLQQFRYVNSKNIDQGSPIREKAKAIVGFLSDDTKLAKSKQDYERIRREMGTPGIVDLNDASKSRPRASMGSSRASMTLSRSNSVDVNTTSSTAAAAAAAAAANFRTYRQSLDNTAGGRMSGEGRLSLSLPLQMIEEEFEP